MVKTGMALYTAILIASSLAVHSMAMPLSPYHGEEDYGQLRSKRSGSPAFPAIHDYVLSTFIRRYSGLGCQGDGTTCTPIAPQVCDSRAIKFYFPSDDRAEPLGCELTFTVNLESDSLHGAELALFKKTEPESFGKLYYPFILFKLATSSFYTTALTDDEVFISGSCSGWQTLNISKISSILSSGETTFNLLLAVFKSNDPAPMSCAEIKSVFVVDKYANIFGDSSEPPSTTETPTTKDTTTEAKKEDNNSSVDTPNETAVKKEEEEGGSGEGTTEEEPTTSAEESVLAEQYVPTIAFFNDTEPIQLVKRSVDDVVNNNTTNTDQVPTEEEMLDDGIDQASGADCQRLEKKIKLSDIDPSIVKPDILDIGECWSSTETMQCLPSSTAEVHILKKDNEFNTVRLELFQQHVILTCEPHFVPTQASTADQASTTIAL